MRKSISWRGLKKLIRLAKNEKKWRIPPLLGMREQIFLLLLVFFGLKSLLRKQKLNLHSGFLIGQYNFTQHILFMILIKFENHDKASSKTEKSLFLLLQ